MTILVTGGAGFIGSHVVDGLVADGHRVMVVDNLSTGLRDNVNQRADFIKADVEDDSIEGLFTQQSGIRVVVHLAAQSSVAVSWHRPVDDARANVLGLVNMLECCRRHGVEQFLFSSSAAVYGDPERLPVDETALPCPRSPYALSKLIGERYIKMYSNEYGMRAFIMRFSNVYGPRQRADSESGVVSAFTHAFVHNEQLQIRGDGYQTRDFIYVANVADAVKRAIACGAKGIYNISTNTSTTVMGLYETMCSTAGMRPRIAFAPARPGDIRHSRLENSKAMSELRWMPSTNLCDGLRETLEAARVYAPSRCDLYWS